MDKQKQSMSEEELGKVSGGSGQVYTNQRCPFCRNSYGVDILVHIDRCVFNPDSPNYIGDNIDILRP